MLARIQFSRYDDDNRLDKDGLKNLSDFIGEDIGYSQMKIDDKGQPASLSYLETFEKEKVENNKDYTLVTPSDMYQISDNKTFVVDLEKFMQEFPKLKITIHGVPKSISHDYQGMIDQMNAIGEKIEEAKNKFNKVVEFNQKCNIHVSNMGLMSINKLAYATDICTEELQGILDKGWRIIAVCPQPDQRRPDYILGMSISDIDEDVTVTHFSGSGREKELRAYDERKDKELNLA